MIEEAAVIEKLHTLPPDKQAEVVDFLEFLLERYGPGSGAKPASPLLSTKTTATNQEVPNGTRLAAFVGDPLNWQREVRKDCPLPGREEGQ